MENLVLSFPVQTVQLLFLKKLRLLELILVCLTQLAMVDIQLL